MADKPTEKDREQPVHARLHALLVCDRYGSGPRYTEPHAAAAVRLTFRAGGASGLAVIKTKSSLTSNAGNPAHTGRRAGISGPHSRGFAVRMAPASAERV